VDGPDPNLDVCATRDETGGTLVLKVVNAWDKARHAEITVDGTCGIDRRIDAWTLAGFPPAVNAPDAPNQVRWKKSTFSVASGRFSYDFPAWSYVILRLHSRP